jgi:hypothetical protein
MSIILKSFWVQRIRLASTCTLLFLSSAVVTTVLAASSLGMPGEDLCHSDSAERNCSVEASPIIIDNLVRNPSVALATPRTITAIIQSFTALRVSIDLTEVFPSGIGTPFIYRLSFLVDRGFTVSDVMATPTGGGTCTVQANLDISCNGVLTRLEIFYRYAYTPTLHPPHVILGFGGSDTTLVDYTVNVEYPATLTFVESTPPPDSHNPTSRSLVWTKSSAFEFRPNLRFQALNLYGTWLPLINR